MAGLSRSHGTIRVEHLIMCFMYLLSRLMFMPVGSDSIDQNSPSSQQDLPGQFHIPVYVHRETEGRSKPENDLHSTNPVCDLEVKTSDAKSFAKRVRRRSINFAYLHLKFTSNATVSVRDDVFLPNVWIWTFTTPGGAYPYLHFPNDINILSLGILSYYTLNANLTIETSPQNCSLVIGEKKTTKHIANLLATMILTNLENPLVTNYSAFCHIVKLNRFVDGKPSYYISKYLGIWEDLTGYKCCWLYRDQQGELQTQCEHNKTKTLSGWTTFFSLIGIVCFMYSPIPLCAVCNSLTLPTRSVKNHYEYEEIDQSEDEERPPMFSECSTADGDADQWLYLGMDMPVTILTIFCRPFSFLKNYPVLTSRILRMFIFLVIIPSVLVLKVYIYSSLSKMATRNRLKANIPVGFLSIPYGFWESYNNWLTIFGGPYVVFGVYLILGLTFFCAPKRLSDLLTTVLRDRRISENTILSLNLKTTQEFGAISCTDKTGYALILSTMKCNLYSLLNPQFWKYVLNFCRERAERLHIKRSIRPKPIQWACILAYCLLCSLESVLCVFYFGFPSIFFMYLTVRAYVIHFAADKCRIPISVLIIVSLIFIFYSFYLIFIRTAIFLLSIIDFTYIGILVYPNIALGFIIGAGTMLVYLSRSTQKLKDGYLTLFHNVVKISMELEKTTAEKSSFVRESTLVLPVCNFDINGVETLQIGGVTFKLTNQQRNILRETQPFNRCTSARNQKYVSWKGVHPGIPVSLFEQVMEIYRPLRVSVFIFIVELVAFSVVVTSVLKLILVFGRVGNFVLPAQVVTAVALTILPKLNDFFKSVIEKRIEEDMTWRKLTVTVKKYYAKRKNFASNRQHAYNTGTELEPVHTMR